MKGRKLLRRAEMKRRSEPMSDLGARILVMGISG
jgi:hypothetical protein